MADRDPESLFRKLREAIGLALIGNDEAVQLALTTLLARGHLLIEDRPGVGKTLLARAFTRALGGRFERIQCTADMMPSDMTGVHVLNQDGDGRGFQLREGPLFGDVVLADEINRAGPRTQSAMLQAMDDEGFGNCTNHYECEAACPKEISVDFIARMNRDYLKAKFKRS